MAVTLKDVAALAGVSTSTVSRTCNNSPSISRETKERVRQAMLTLGYEFSTAAPIEDIPTSKAVGIILPPSDRAVYENSFYLEMIRGITLFCNQRQYISVLLTGRDDNELLHVVQDMSNRKSVGGFIVLYSRQNDPIVEYLYSEGLLYVLIGKAYEYPNQTVYVDNDNFLAGQEATAYLCSLGHKRIGYLGTDQFHMFSAERRSGYRSTLSKYGLPLDPSLCIEVPCVSEEIVGYIRTLLNRSDRPTALVVSDDQFTMALRHACGDMGLRIPEDLSVISFNNSLFARMMFPPLTSMDLNSYQLGIEAASQFINHLENPNLMATKTIVPHRLVERGSCATLQSPVSNK